jgi:hypothetical protein
VSKTTKKEQSMDKIRKDLGITPPKKVRKKRKPMSEEQRAAAVERLAKARAARGITGTKNVHPDVLALPDDHTLSYKNVKEWLDYNSDYLKSIKSQKDSTDRDERREYQIVDVYVKNLRVYIKDNVWCDHKYGKKMENKMEWVTVVPSGKTQ